MSLHDTLAAWAASMRLPEAAAAEIYRRIVVTPAPVNEGNAGLDPRWWREFTADFADRLVSSVRPPRWAA